MRCFVAGGTGVIGRRGVPLLVEAGHDVSVLSRTAERDREVAAMGATPVRADLFDTQSLRSAAVGQDAIVNLATHIPPLSRAARTSAWVENDRIRSEGVANLVVAAEGNGVGRFVQESITFPYEDAGDVWISEDHPRSLTGVGEAVALAEGAVNEFTSRETGAGVVLRFGQFYATDSVHSASFASMFRRGLNPLLGDPDGYVSFIGMDAAARAVRVLAWRSMPGCTTSPMTTLPPAPRWELRWRRDLGDAEHGAFRRS